MTPSGPTITRVLTGDITDLQPFHGFGGLHGGLTAALLLRRARTCVGADRVPVETTVHFLRPVTSLPDLTADVVLDGRSTTVVASAASTSTTVAASATTVLSAPRTSTTPCVVATFPDDLIALDQTQPFVVPPEFVPISTRTEVRPARPALPFTGQDHPRLSAWIRLTEPVPDPFERLLILADVLAPSYAAVLTELRSIPSVRISVHFAPAVATTPFEWVLVTAETGAAGIDGWLSEDLTIWTPNGTLLATSTQLRAIR